MNGNFNIRFRDEMKGITPILSAVPPTNTMSRAMVRMKETRKFATQFSAANHKSLRGE